MKLSLLVRPGIPEFRNILQTKLRNNLRIDGIDLLPDQFTATEGFDLQGIYDADFESALMKKFGDAFGIAAGGFHANVRIFDAVF